MRRIKYELYVILEFAFSLVPGYLGYVIVGNIKIGSDVLIAPNSFVNMDVPSNSLVIGNPAVIKKKDNPTQYYINNKWLG